MQKYATRFQMVVNLPAGYTIVDWGMGKAGLYLRHPYNNGWHGKSLLSAKGKWVSTATRLAASGTREELEAWVAELQR